MTNLLEIEIAQGQFSWPLSEETEKDYDLFETKVWASKQIEYWVPGMKRHLAIKTYNLNRPIFVKVYWNGVEVEELVQVVLTKDRIIREHIDFRYKIMNRLYLLITRTEFDSEVHKRTKSAKGKEQGEGILNIRWILNAVECNQLDLPKYGSAILYTGMIN